MPTQYWSNGNKKPNPSKAYTDQYKQYYDSRVAAAEAAKRKAADLALQRQLANQGVGEKKVTPYTQSQFNQNYGARPNSAGDAWKEYYDSRLNAAKTNPASIKTYGGGLRDDRGNTVLPPGIDFAALARGVGGSSGGSGGLGSSGGGSGSVPEPSMPVEPSPADQLASLLGALPKGPTGIENIQGGYGSLQADYEKSQGTANTAFDATKAALEQMYGQTQGDLQGRESDYVSALLSLNDQNKNTQLGTNEQLRGIRGTYLGDLGTSISARSADAVTRLTEDFNAQKQMREKEIIDAFMQQQAELAAAATGGGSSGGGGGGRRSSGGGSSKSSLGTASIKEDVYNPQNLEILNSLDPEVASHLQRAWNLSSTHPETVLQKEYDTGQEVATTAANKSKIRDLNAQIARAFFPSGASSSKKIAAGSKSQAAKAAANAEAIRKALLAAQSFGGIQGNPKVVYTSKS